MTNYCELCGCEIDEDKELCEDCMDDFASAVIHTDGIFPDEEDFNEI